MKLNDAMIEVIAEAKRNDMPNLAICGLVGIEETTYYDWMRHGQEKLNTEIDSIYVKFYQTIKKAEHDAIRANLDNIKNAARNPQQWTASAWLLERCYRKMFGKDVEIGEALEKQIKELAAKLESLGK